jgi:hypothetical protein
MKSGTAKLVALLYLSAAFALYLRLATPSKTVHARTETIRIGALNHPGRLAKLARSSSEQAPTDAECRAALGVPCYSP